MSLDIPSGIQANYEWMNAAHASELIALAKHHGARHARRLAQGRGILGQCKVQVQFTRRHSWAANNDDYAAFVTAARAWASDKPGILAVNPVLQTKIPK
jgi:hypothetical protein